MLFIAQDLDPLRVVGMMPAVLPLPATPSSTEQRPRRSRARAPKADKVSIAKVAAQHVSREEGCVEFTSEIVREKVDAKVSEREKDEADKIARAAARK